MLVTFSPKKLDRIKDCGRGAQEFMRVNAFHDFVDDSVESPCVSFTLRRGFINPLKHTNKVAVRSVSEHTFTQ